MEFMTIDTFQTLLAVANWLLLFTVAGLAVATAVLIVRHLKKRNKVA